MQIVGIGPATSPMTHPSPPLASGARLRDDERQTGSGSGGAHGASGAAGASGGDDAGSDAGRTAGNGSDGPGAEEWHGTGARV